jgi:hypothetical protein
MSALRGTVALVAALIVPITARAADLPVIRIFPPACETSPVSFDEFVDALRVELAGRQPHCCVVGPGDPGDAVKVTLSIEPCDGTASQQIDVVVDVAAPPRTMQRPVSLADLPPEARPRALALAVAELIREAGEPAQPAPPAVAPPDSGREPAFGERIDAIGSVAGEMRHHFGHGSTLWGARLALSLVSGRWQATVDAGAATSRNDFSVGEVSVLLASGALFAGPRFVAGPVVVSVGPTGALGWARITGQSSTADIVAGQGSGLVATAGLRAAIEGPVGHVIGLCGWLEGGLTVRHLDADVLGAPSAGIAGPYLLIAAGVRFGPS